MSIGEQDMLSDGEGRHELEVCQEIGRQARAFYPGSPWDQVEPHARQVWESQDTSAPWEEVAPLVQAIWREPEA